jgi:tetratricopeptide (TPR) repeat protein
MYVHQSLMAAAPAVDLLPKARDAAIRALEFGNDLTAVHAILATVAAYHDWDWESAEKEYLKALALDPQDPFVRLQYAKLLVLRGRTDAAMDQVGRLGAVHPRRAVLEGGQAGIYYLSRQYDRAIAHCKAVLEVMPEAGDCSYWMGRAYLSKGMAAEAVDALEVRRSNPAMGFAGPIAAYLAAGQRSEALRLRTEVEALAERRHISPVSLAGMYFSFGERDSGFRQLERAIQDRDPSLLTLRVEPAYDEVRPDPRFQKILRRLRL